MTFKRTLITESSLYIFEYFIVILMINLYIHTLKCTPITDEILRTNSDENKYEVLKNDGLEKLFNKMGI